MQRPTRSPPQCKLGRTGLPLIHPATRPPTRERRPRAATHAHKCAHPSRPKRDRAIPTEKDRKALRTLQGSFRRHVAARGLARWRSIIPRTRKPAETRARWQSIASTRSHAPLPPTEPRQGCERTAQLSPSQARVPTSTTHERKHVCRWEARAGPQLDKVTLQYVTKAHGQGGRRRLPAVHGRRWQAN